jgi:PKD repeat protein
MRKKYYYLDDCAINYINPGTNKRIMKWKIIILFLIFFLMIFPTLFLTTFTITKEDGVESPISEIVDDEKEVTIEKTVENEYPTSIINTKVQIYNKSTDKINTVELRRRYRNHEIIFEGRNSYDIDGRIIKYSWDFGDGTQASGDLIRHTYEELGDYNVSLEVTDNNRTTNSTVITMTIVNNSPYAFISDVYAKEFYTYEKIHFKATNIYRRIGEHYIIDWWEVGSYDPDGIIVNYTWDFGNGDVSFGENVDYYYKNNGIYPLTLRVIDNDGDEDSSTRPVIILNRAPSPCIGNRFAPWPTPPDDYLKPLKANKTFDYNSIYFIQSFKNFTFTETSRDIDGKIILYEWDFDGDNITDYMSTENGNATYRFEETGVFRCGFTVTDDDGARTTVRVNFIVNDNLSFKPQINITSVKEFDGSPFGNPMISLSFIGQFLSPSFDDFELDYGDGNRSSDPNSWHDFPIGQYEIDLKATSGSEIIRMAIILNVD